MYWIYNIGSGVSAFVVCLAFILSFSSFSLSALCKKNHLRSSVSFLCLFCTILPKPAYCYLCAISLIFLLDLCSLVPSSRSAVCFMLSLCYLCAIYALLLWECSLLHAIAVLSLCYRWSFMLGDVFCSVLSLCYLCAISAISVLSMVCHAWRCRWLCAISVLSMVFHAGECFLLCAISVLSPCYFSKICVDILHRLDEDPIHPKWYVPQSR